MPTSWTAAENELVTWLETATGLAGKVILGRQSAPQLPTRPYLTVIVSTPRSAFSMFPITTEDFDAGRTGREFSYTATFEEEVTVKVQAYTDETNGDAAAARVLSKARAALGLESVRAPLRAAGLALSEVGDMQDLTTLVNTAFQGRAALDVRFLVTNEAVEFVGYVATIGLTGKVAPEPPDGGTKTVIDNKTVKVSL